MESFKYRAIDPLGNNFDGKISAIDIAEARRKVTESGFIVVQIEKVSFINKYVQNIEDKSISIKYLAGFCRQMQIIIRSGVGVLKGVAIMKEQSPNKKISEFLNKVYIEVQKGRSFSESMSDSGFQIPFLLINMISIGEETGNLEDILLSMAIYYEKEQALKGKIISAMIYPVIMALISVGLVGFFLVFVMPEIMSVFEDADDLPAITLLVMNIADFLTDNIVFIILGIVFSIVGIKLFVPSNTIRAVRGYIFNKTPFLREAIKDIVTTRFLRNFGLMIGAGIPIIKSLESVIKIIDNNMIRKIMKTAIEGIKRGERLGDNFASHKYLDPVVIHMINVGQETGELETILETIAGYYERSAEGRITKLTAGVEPLLIVVLGLVMGVLVVAMVLPMFDMVGQMQG